ncbi:hypothetical protein N7520_011390 [Penicillium odoratum]|uniref:uncharacterized protein n=1 Tax=Penicillium odoratum TaxID=1167516 RepID=UPI002547F908|nr:uncharacterized protein N7520_011390 [Penicillium odoratum]KAJ5746208.1 hypothetical protein N7520_011390 [Penicillium odoratum]
MPPTIHHLPDMPPPGMEGPSFESTHEEVIKEEFKEKNYERVKEEVNTEINEENHEQAKCEIIEETREETIEEIGENFKAVITGESKEESRDEFKEVMKRETVEVVDKVSADTPIPTPPISYLTPLRLDKTWEDPENICDDINSFLREHVHGITKLVTPPSQTPRRRLYKCDLLQPRSHARINLPRQAFYQYSQGCPFRINAEFLNGSWGIIVLNATYNHGPSTPASHSAQLILERKKKRKAVHEMMDLNFSTVEIVRRVIAHDLGAIFDRRDVDLIRVSRKARLSRASRKVLLVDGPMNDTGDDLPKYYETPEKESDDEMSYKMPKKEIDDDELGKNPKKESDDRNDYKMPKQEAIDELYKIPKHTESELDVVSNESELWRRTQIFPV